MFTVIAMWFMKSKTASKEEKLEIPHKEPFKMLTTMKDTSQDEIFRALSDPKSRQMWDIGLKNAKLVDSYNKCKVLRLEYVGD